MALQISVVVQYEAHKSAVEVRQVMPDRRFPDILPGRLRREEHYPLALAHHHPLQQHEPDKGFAQTHAVTEKGAVVLLGDMDQILIGILLILVEHAEDAGRLLVPHVRGESLALEQLTAP